LNCEKIAFVDMAAHPLDKSDRSHPMMATIAMMQALHMRKPKAAPAPRRKSAKHYKIVR
jgi:hypothetical protein